MKTAVRRTTAGFAVAATAGVSTLFVGVAPAYAANEACGPTGTVIAPGICEQIFGSGAPSLTITPQMTKLEVLLVGAGGSGGNQTSPNTNGYATGGGGGEVKVVNFTGTAGTQLNMVVAAPGTPGTPGSVTDGTLVATVANGLDGETDGGVGGASGNGNPGFDGSSVSTPGPYYGAGAGAGSSPTAQEDGGAGVVVNTLPLVGGSLFAADTRCFGGGGAIGITNGPGAQGDPGCGGGGPSGAALFAPAPNSGGGGGGLDIPQNATVRGGARGAVIVRWTAANVTLSFNTSGKSVAPAPQVLTAGTTATKPADPTADMDEFLGWYTSASFTTPADFSAPVTGSTTYYARWRSTLPATGSTIDATALTAGALTLVAGVGLVVLGRRRRREAD